MAPILNKRFRCKLTGWVISFNKAVPDGSHVMTPLLCLSRQNLNFWEDVLKVQYEIKFKILPKQCPLAYYPLI